MKNVPFDAELVEYIVAEVIRRLRDGGASIAIDAAGGDNNLEIDEQVVTLAKLRGKLVGVRQLVVRPRAIVTPSVHDELKEKGVQLVRR